MIFFSKIVFEAFRKKMFEELSSNLNCAASAVAESREINSTCQRIFEFICVYATLSSLPPPPPSPSPSLLPSAVRVVVVATHTYFFITFPFTELLVRFRFRTSFSSFAIFHITYTYKWNRRFFFYIKLYTLHTLEK